LREREREKKRERARTVVVRRKPYTFVVHEPTGAPSIRPESECQRETFLGVAWDVFHLRG